MYVPNRLRSIAASLRQVAINQGKIALGFVIGGIATIAISAALADINNGSSTLGNTSSVLLSQETSKIADNLKQDAEVFDTSKAATSLALFVQSFGERPDANVQRKQRDRRPPVVQCNW